MSINRVDINYLSRLVRKDMLLKDAEKLLGNKKAILIFRCADCKALELLEGYEDVHLATSSQLAGESRKLYCAVCA